MPYRRFGATGVRVSEVSFDARAIGGKAYGAVDPQESLRAFARAEELGCNLVDTARMYGDSERVLGESAGAVGLSRRNIRSSRPGRLRL